MNASDPADSDAKRRELAALRDRVRQLEAELTPQVSHWPPQRFYHTYYATSGGVLGGVAAGASLVANIVGAPLAGKSALELIRIYLTFPLGARALEMTTQSGALILTLGCCLYIFTGMALGVPLYWLMVRIAGDHASLGKRLLVASGLALALWLINFYGILAWLQPLLFGGNWITDPNILPPWVAAGTHLIFGWVIALLHPWAQFTPYRPAQTVHP
jgi:hypothetical protein